MAAISSLPDAAVLLLELGALAGAAWAIIRTVRSVRSGVADRVEGDVTLRRDVDELARQMKAMRHASAADHGAIKDRLTEAEASRKELHREVAELDRRLVDLAGDVRVIRARIDAHGVNGGGRHAA